MGPALDQVIRQLAAGGVLDPLTVRGCSEAEIGALETEYGLRLPRAYREFLAAMGRAAGDFLSGTDFLYADLPPLLEYAYDLLSESEEPIALHLDDFVFAMHQGYAFLFFRCGASEDPPVFLYEETQTGFAQVADSFSSWLASAAADEAEAAAALRK